MRSIRGIGAVVLGGAIGVLLAGSPLEARQVPADTAARMGLDTLRVTVVRSAQDLRTVPLAVTAVEVGRSQASQPGLALDEVLRAIPGVQIDNRFNFAQGERISIRGFGARSQFGVRGIKVLVDGIPATLPDGQTTLNLEIGAISRAEVIRGPASALYGNAAGGVVQLETALPAATPMRQEFRVVGGDHGMLRVESRTGGRVGRAFYQANITRFDYDGYRDFADASHLFGNAQVGFQTGRDDLRLVLNWVDYTANDPGSLSDALLRADRTQAFQMNRDRRTSKEGQQAQLGSSWRRVTGAGELEVAAYGLTRALDNPIIPRVIDLDRRAGGFRALFRGSAEAGDQPLRWVVGAESDVMRDDRRNHLNTGGGTRGERVLDQIERVTGLGVFGEVTVPAGERVALLTGLRYDTFRFRAEDRLITATNPDDSGERTMQATSPFAGLVLTLSEAVAVYGNVGTAFQTPTTTELANRPSGAGGFNPELEPQRTTSWEVGLRGRIAGNVAYGLAGYRADVENELIGFQVPATPGRTFFRNAGSTVHRGVEAELAASPIRGLTTRAAYTYTDARFESYATAAQTYDGNRVPGISPHRFDLGTRYQPGPWFGDLQLRSLSPMQVDDANQASSPGYALVDLRAGIDGVRLRGLELSPFLGVNNALDRLYNSSVVVNAAGARYFEPGPGRSVFAGLGVAFGR